MKKVLIIDDESSITKLLKLNLEKTGVYTVRDVNKASRALDTAREFLPDIILLDVMMPELDGGEVAALIRADLRLQGVPIVFLTAAVKQEEINANSGMIGGFPYIAKPLNVKGVIRVIEEKLAA